jgi:hypothetical protein
MMQISGSLGILKATAAPEVLRHIQWLSSAYGKRTTAKDFVGINAKRLQTEQRIFQDSRDPLVASPFSILDRKFELDGWSPYGWR